MKTLLRALSLLLVVLWVGAILFFPVVAAVSFGNLPDSHTAGIVVRLCLRFLHLEGLAAGGLLVLLLLVAGRVGAYGRGIAAPVLVTLVMLAGTAFSQFVIIPPMEQDRLALGGSVDAAPAGDAHRLHFDRLHAWSVRVEGGVLSAGLVLVLLLARSPLK